MNLEREKISTPILRKSFSEPVFPEGHILIPEVDFWRMIAYD